MLTSLLQSSVDLLLSEHKILVRLLLGDELNNHVTYPFFSPVLLFPILLPVFPPIISHQPPTCPHPPPTCPHPPPTCLLPPASSHLPPASSHLPPPTSYPGAWYTILEVVSKLAVVTNALLIAITAQFVPIETYRYGGFRPDSETGINGYVNWSLSPFYIDALLDGEAFPSVSAQRLGLFDLEGNDLMAADGSDLLYLPYVDIPCLVRMNVSEDYTNDNGQTFPRFYPVENENLTAVTGITEAFSRNSWIDFYNNRTYVEYLFGVSSSSEYEDISPLANSAGDCFIPLSKQCRLVCTIIMHVTLSSSSSK